MRYFSILPLHAYGTVPQWVTSGPVAASAAHYTTLAVASQEVGRFVHKFSSPPSCDFTDLRSHQLTLGTIGRGKQRYGCRRAIRKFSPIVLRALSSFGQIKLCRFISTPNHIMLTLWHFPRFLSIQMARGGDQIWSAIARVLRKGKCRARF